MRKSFGFVVLNYNNYEETIECVDSILAISGSNYYVVIVDNDSPNNSLEILSEKCSNYNNIRIMHSGRNGGYSYGNNCGIRLLKSIGIHDVIIATSDTLIVSKDILQQLESIDTEKIGIIGPKVTGFNSENQNPAKENVNLKYIFEIYFSSADSFCRNLVYKISPSLKRAIRVRKDNSRKSAIDRYVYMVHGCFLYLTNTYLEKCGYLDEALFMYGEEDLLAYNCFKNDLRVLYKPSVEILHKDARSTPKENYNTFIAMNYNQSRKHLRTKFNIASLLLQIIRRQKSL
jgi:GT2 family glycosyltransferase